MGTLFLTLAPLIATIVERFIGSGNGDKKLSVSVKLLKTLQDGLHDVGVSTDAGLFKDDNQMKALMNEVVGGLNSEKKLVGSATVLPVTGAAYPNSPLISQLLETVKMLLPQGV